MAFQNFSKTLSGHSAYNKVRHRPLIPYSFLESFVCHNRDEYPIVGIEDGTMVPPLASSFCNVSSQSNVLALVDENGYLIFYDTNKTGEKATVKYWRAHSNAVFDLAWLHKEDKILTASGDQSVILWDVMTQQNLEVFKGHTSSVRSVNFRHQDNAVFASGSRDGHIRLWDRRCNKKEATVSSVNAIKNAHTLQQTALLKRRKTRLGFAPAQDSQQSVTCVMFQSDNILVSAGAVDGCVKVWDLRKNFSISSAESIPLYKFPYQGPSRRSHGFTSLAFDSSNSRLFASCTDDIIYMYDMTSYSSVPVNCYRGHTNSSFYVKAVLSPDDSFLLSGSCDENAYIWKVDSPNESPVVLKGHRSEVSDVSWCPSDMFKIVTLSDDNSMRIWRHDPAQQFRKSHDPSITGTAERTHRDIGVSAVSMASPCTPKLGSLIQSPVVGMKRIGSNLPARSPVTTPKRPRLCESSPSTVSPSIKMWLKRAASDSPITPSETKCPKLRTSVSSPAHLSASSVSKPSELSDSGKQRSDSKLKHSCKRKLVDTDDDQENPKKKQNIKKSPVKCKTFKQNCENDDNIHKENQHVNSDKPSLSESPQKRDKVLKNLESDVNASPVKDVNAYRSSDMLTPVKPRKLDLDVNSPTCNLPNLVVDTPQSPAQLSANEREGDIKKPKVDWLTEMRLRKIASDKSVSDIYEKLKIESSAVQPALSKSPVPGVPSVRSFFKKKSWQ